MRLVRIGWPAALQGVDLSLVRWAEEMPDVEGGRALGGGHRAQSHASVCEVRAARGRMRSGRRRGDGGVRGRAPSLGRQCLGGQEDRWLELCSEQLALSAIETIQGGTSGTDIVQLLGTSVLARAQALRAPSRSPAFKQMRDSAAQAPAEAGWRNTSSSPRNRLATRSVSESCVSHAKDGSKALGSAWSARRRSSEASRCGP